MTIDVSSFTAATAATSAASLCPAVVRVLRRRRETHDTWTLELEPPPGWSSFEPGQFNMLYAFGSGEVPISISGDPSRSDVIVHTVRAVGAVTRAVVALRKDDVVGLRGPFGNGWPLAATAKEDVVIVSGGLGLVPLRPVLLALLAQAVRGRRVILIHGARTARDIVYKRDLERWRRAGVEVELTVDRGDRSWTHHIGVVTTLLAAARIDATRSLALVCGPEVMMRFAIRELQRLGLADERIHVSLERNMQCAIGVCGHCQLGPKFVCTDGPVFRYDAVRALLHVPEL